jgi:hypothetical protein
MKNANRVRGERSGKAVTAQTKKQGDKSNRGEIPFAIERAIIHVAQSFRKIAEENYCEAYYKFYGLLPLIQPHSCFKMQALALREIVQSSLHLNDYVEQCACFREHGDTRGQYNPDERDAMGWFLDYYKPLQLKSFSEVISSFGGFVSWVGDNQRFSHVVKTIRALTESADVLEQFEVLHSQDRACEFVRKLNLEHS